MQNLTLDKKDAASTSTPQPVEGTETPPEDPLMEEQNEKEQAMAKRAYVLKELVDTERDYVNNLGLIVEGYIKALRGETSDVQVPEDLKNGKDKIIFGNIEAVYDWHKE